jgi:catechol 2,3-dioxygenase-like lactoylglutathione lyase family enzyme
MKRRGPLTARLVAERVAAHGDYAAALVDTSQLAAAGEEQRESVDFLDAKKRLVFRRAAPGEERHGRSDQLGRHRPLPAHDARRCGEGEARRFYGTLLGLIEVDRPPRLAPRGCWFVDRASAIHIHLGVGPDFRPATKAHPAFVVRDLDPVRRRLEEAVSEVVEDDAIAGVRRFYTPRADGLSADRAALQNRARLCPARSLAPAVALP